jgi:hypothetical protein
MRKQKKKKNKQIIVVKPKEVYYSLDFTKDELIYLSFAIREYQNSHIIKAWDMERGATQRLQKVVSISEKAAISAESIGKIIENRLLGILDE